MISEQILLETSVSILMPLYNGVEFIEESVSSVINQTAENWELLIAVNGYLPNSDVYQKVFNYILYLNDNRIRVFDYNQCKGKSETLNQMINECSYDYVAILDVDDTWLNNKLNTQMPYILEKYDVIGSKCVYFGDINNVVPYIPDGDISKYNFLSINPIINSSSIIKKKLAYWYKQYDGIEDYELWLRLWVKKCSFYNCNDVLVKHRIHNTSAFNSKDHSKELASLKQKYMRILHNCV